MSGQIQTISENKHDAIRIAGSFTILQYDILRAPKNTEIT